MINDTGLLGKSRVSGALDVGGNNGDKKGLWVSHCASRLDIECACKTCNVYAWSMSGWFRVVQVGLWVSVMG